MARPKGKQVIYNCQECKEDFERPLSSRKFARKLGYKVRFCSSNCRKEYFKKNKKSRKEIWTKFNRKRSTRVYKTIWSEKKRYGGRITIIGSKCAMCGLSKKRMAIHHRDGLNGKHGKELNNDPSNLVVLCQSCHVSVHNRHYLKEVVLSNG